MSPLEAYIQELRDEYSRKAFSNLFMEFLQQIIPGYSPKNPKEHALKDFVARFTNIIISGTESKIIVYGFRLLDVMISLLRSPITGPTGSFEFAEKERHSPLEEQLRWEVVDNAIGHFRRYWDTRIKLKTKDKYTLASARPRILFEYISGLASRGFIPQEPLAQIVLMFVHNFQNRTDLRNAACIFRSITCPTLLMKEPDVLFEILGVLRCRCRDLFGIDTIIEERDVADRIYKAIFGLDCYVPTLLWEVETGEVIRTCEGPGSRCGCGQESIVPRKHTNFWKKTIL